MQAAARQVPGDWGDLPHRDAAYGTNGMVASASKRAAAAGLEVLRRGGNAFDAAVAVGSVEWLTLPWACGLGGDMFAVLYDARRDRLAAINGSGVCAFRASREYYADQGLAMMPLNGWHSVAVPGAPDAYATLHREFGTLPLGELLAPAAAHAERGVLVSRKVHRQLAGTGKLRQYPGTAALYLPGGQAPAAGTRWYLPELAASIRALGREGPDVFYRGWIAEEIVRACEAGGGLLGLQEFAEHITDLYEPLHTRYRGVDVYENGPPSQGFMLLEWLNILEGYDLPALGWNSAELIHLHVETKKLVFADRLRYVGDPRFVDNPLASLLSPAWAAGRRQAVDMARANHTPAAGLLPERAGDTSYFAVMDGQGNAVSLIHSLSGGFGGGVVGGQSGILLNNRAGRGFTLEAGHPNAIAGGKKTMHTLNAYLLMREGRPFVVGGTPGGDYQPQWNVQAISNLLDFGLDVQTAAEAPRWASVPGTDPDTVAQPFVVHLERLPHEVGTALERRGHTIRRLPPWQGPGAIQLIMRDEHGTLLGGTDPRGDGAVLGY
jgi:gamma-glutamyltranspeptidase/glutathione hydrolase